MENCARHILGMSAVGRSKAVALAERVNHEIPGATVNGTHQMPAVTPEAVAAAVAAQKGGPGNKEQFLS